MTAAKGGVRLAGGAESEAPLPTSATGAAFGEMIDYAGLFPPAGLSLEVALREYLEAAAGRASWLLGRFACPAIELTRVDRMLAALGVELEATAVIGAQGPTTVWDAAVSDGARAIAAATPELTHLEIGSIEVAAPSIRAPDEAARRAAEVLAALADAKVAPTDLYLELPVAGCPAPATVATVNALARARGRRGVEFDLRAKVRCGGESAHSVPSPDSLAHFLAACRDSGIPAKATAGLHDPLHQRAANGTTGAHGFLNVVMAATLGHASGLAAADLAEILGDDDPASFSVEEDRLAWRGMGADSGSITAARRGLFVSYGSCSFGEPLEGMRSLGLVAR